MGNLRFLTASAPVSSKIPRDTSVHTFRVAFDFANGNTSSAPTAITFPTAAVIHVYFPSDYHLAFYNSKPNASIDEWISDSTTNSIYKNTTNNPPSVSSVTASGNRVTINLNVQNSTVAGTAYKFDPTTWRYWDIKITNIINPIDTTAQSGPPVTQTTRPFMVTLTNVGGTHIYQTYTNVNSYISDPLSTKQYI